ncbi:MAG: hypothetical protein R3251_03365 [Candidatus Spechtbacterales bacterium]|nr:hypothetical protein [Candidatus Spechtbacterales bacterium]
MKVLYATFAFGVPQNTIPNRALSQWTTTKAIANEASVYTQADIVLLDESVEVRRVEESPGNPPPTLRIARGAAEYARELGVDEIHVLAAEPHRWRALRDQRKAVEELDLDVEVKPANIPNVGWYDKQSSQKRVRSCLNWWPRELILRAMPFSLYKRVAS